MVEAEEDLMMSGTVHEEQMLTLDPEPMSSRRARHYVQDELGQAGTPVDVIETAVLLTSELVTNAVLHARTPLTVEVTVAQASLTVAVTDESPHPVELQKPTIHETHGRGIALVDRLAACWGVEALPPGKRVWFAMPLAVRVA